MHSLGTLLPAGEAQWDRIHTNTRARPAAKAEAPAAQLSVLPQQVKGRLNLALTAQSSAEPRSDSSQRTRHKSLSAPLDPPQIIMEGEEERGKSSILSPGCLEIVECSPGRIPSFLHNLDARTQHFQQHPSHTAPLTA